jgi:Asp-tRNA(Asn)/Glu-tRNA(Gln) amidotransferase B subunit
MKDVMSAEVHDALAGLRCGSLKMVYARHELDKGLVYCTLKQVKQPATEAEIKESVAKVFADNPDKVKQLKENPARIGWFVGQTMKALEGAADPEMVCFHCTAIMGENSK